MIQTLALLLAVTLQPPADSVPTDAAAKARAAFAAEADEGYAAPAAQQAKKDEKPKELRVRSRRSDFDREGGVAMFEDRVIVDYDEDFTLTADRLFVFMVGSNRLERIVASGHVTITNETRYGAAAMATFTKATSVVNMYGDRTGAAWLYDKPNRVAGSRIRFKIDSEQVEVVRPVFDVENAGGSEKLLK